MQKKRPIVVRVEFYNFLVYYFSNVANYLAFAANQLDHAELLSTTALSTIDLSTDKAAFEKISRLNGVIKSTSADIKLLASIIQREKIYCKEKQYDCCITVSAKD